MSRIGKQPVTIPSGVNVTVSADTVSVKGPKGELSQWFDADRIKVEVVENEVLVTTKGDNRNHRAKHGLYRALINNMVFGCTEGFTRELEINGVGYSAKGSKSKLTLQIGFCHPVEITMPKGVEVETPSNTKIVLSGIDKQVVGQIAAEIREVRPPEPYKGKGIKYVEEYIRRKAGKTVAAQ